MKKLLFLLTMTLCGINRATYSFEETSQSKLKANILLQDGTSFQAFEDTLRAKYAQIKIPKIDITTESPDIAFAVAFENSPIFWDMKEDHAPYIYNVGDPFETRQLEFKTGLCEKYFNPHIRVHPLHVHKLTSAVMEWTILHESGHLNKPGVPDFILWASPLVQASTLAFWGIHKSKPYKNIMTKMGSKALAFIAVSNLWNQGAMRQEEKRADRFANTHADEQALHGGIELFTKMPLETDQNFFKNALLEFQQLPGHPTRNSRISKIKKELKNRFNVDA